VEEGFQDNRTEIPLLIGHDKNLPAQLHSPGAFHNSSNTFVAHDLKTAMKKTCLSLLILFLFCWAVGAQELRSPNNQLSLQFSLLADGTPQYALSYKGKAVVKPSKLGFLLKNDKKSLLNDFVVADTKTSSFDETWKPV